MRSIPGKAAMAVMKCGGLADFIDCSYICRADFKFYNRGHTFIFRHRSVEVMIRFPGAIYRPRADT